MAYSAYRRLSSFQENQRANSNLSVMVTIINVILIIISSVILLCSQKEEPTTPIRAFIYGYIVLSLLEMFISWAMSCSSDMEGVSVAVCFYCILLVLVFIWLIVGIYWVSTGGQSLQDHAPHLFWLTVVLVGMPIIEVIIAICCSCCCAVAISAAAGGDLV